MGGQALGGFIAWRRHERAVASAAEVTRRHEYRLMKMSGVVGVGIGQKDGKEIIRIYVEKESPQILADLPPAMDSVTSEPADEAGSMTLCGAPSHSRIELRNDLF